jgi:hypothetical protein
MEQVYMLLSGLGYLFIFAVLLGIGYLFVKLLATGLESLSEHDD